MKRCPHCNRVEADDALTFCRADGALLVRDGADTTETRIFPTGEVSGSPTGTTVLRSERAAAPPRPAFGLMIKTASRRSIVLT
jgi:hypothetical protein